METKAIANETKRGPGIIDAMRQSVSVNCENGIRTAMIRWRGRKASYHRDA